MSRKQFMLQLQNQHKSSGPISSTNTNKSFYQDENSFYDHLTSLFVKLDSDSTHDQYGGPVKMEGGYELI